MKAAAILFLFLFFPFLGRSLYVLELHEAIVLEETYVLVLKKCDSMSLVEKKSNRVIIEIVLDKKSRPSWNMKEKSFLSMHSNKII